MERYFRTVSILLAGFLYLCLSPTESRATSLRSFNTGNVATNENLASGSLNQLPPQTSGSSTVSRKLGSVLDYDPVPPRNTGTETEVDTNQLTGAGSSRNKGAEGTNQNTEQGQIGQEETENGSQQKTLESAGRSSLKNVDQPVGTGNVASSRSGENLGWKSKTPSTVKRQNVVPTLASPSSSQKFPESAVNSLSAKRSNLTDRVGALQGGPSTGQDNSVSDAEMSGVLGKKPQSGEKTNTAVGPAPTANAQGSVLNRTVLSGGGKPAKSGEQTGREGEVPALPAPQPQTGNKDDTIAVVPGKPVSNKGDQQGAGLPVQQATKTDKVISGVGIPGTNSGASQAISQPRPTNASLVISSGNPTPKKAVVLPVLATTTKPSTTVAAIGTTPSEKKATTSTTTPKSSIKPPLGVQQPVGGGTNAGTGNQPVNPPDAATGNQQPINPPGAGTAGGGSQNVAGGNAPDQKPVGRVLVPEPRSTHFLSYLITGVVLVAVIYLAFHNKQKLIGLIVEGRVQRSTGSRRPNNGQYSRLKQEDEDGRHAIY